MKAHLCLLCLVICFSSIYSNSASATSYTWNGGSSGSWSNTSNWSPSTGYPGSGGSTTDDVTFNTNNVTITVPAAVTINSITVPYGYSGLNIQFTGSAPTLTVATISLAQTYGTELTFSSSGTTGTVNVTSALSSYYGGSILISANTTLNVGAGITINFNGNQANITNNGTINFANGCILTLGFNSTFYNNGIVTAIGTIFETPAINGSQSPIINTGTFNCTAYSQININTQNSGVTNSGASAIFTLNSSYFSILLGSNSSNITNSNGATFTANNNSTIYIAAYQAYIKNSATFQAGTSNSPCTITVTGQGASSGNTSIVNTGTFTVGSTSMINLTGTDPSNPNIITNTSPGTFTFQSDANGTGALGPLGAGSKTLGTFIVQRYITGSTVSGSYYRGYRLLSSPVADAANSSYYNLSFLKGSGTYLTGASGGGFDATGNPTIYLYNQGETPNNSSFLVGNYRGVTAINNSPAYNLGTIDGNFNLPIGNGYLFFFRGNNSTNTAAAPTTQTFNMTGTLNQGQVIVKDWYSTATSAPYYLGYSSVTGNSSVEGFNLVGNPYPCPIDWNTAYLNILSTYGIYAPNVGNSIYIWNTTTKNYSVYMNTLLGGTASGSAGGTNIIPSGQGFFVQALNAYAQVIFNESAKFAIATQVTGSNLLLSKAFASTQTDQHLRLQLYKDPTNIDENVIIFKAGTSPAYVKNEDALYLQGQGVVSLSDMSSDNYALAINVQPFPQKSQTIPLNVSATSDGLYSLKLTETVNIPPLYDVWLMDAYKKDSLDIKHNPTYNFNLAVADTNSYGTKRFSLVIRVNTGYAYKLRGFSGAKVTGGSQLTWTTQNEETYTGFSLQRSTDGGKTFVSIDSLQSTSAGSYGYLDANPAPGVNLYRLLQNDINGNITYSNMVQLVYPGTGLPPGNMVIYPNPASSVVNLAILATNNTAASYTINIMSSTGSVVKTATAQQPTWQSDTSGLTPGIYIMQVINNADKTIVGTNKFIKL